jgi:type IV secretion system protein VirD4
MKAMKNYAGHRLSPWLGHMMVSRSETARPLLTPGEVMQLPAADEIVMVAGTPPIRATKARYFEDRRLQERVMPPPTLRRMPRPAPDDWSELAMPQPPATDGSSTSDSSGDEDTTGSEQRRQPEIDRAPAIVAPKPQNEFEFDPIDDADDDLARSSRLRDTMRQTARQASLNPGDGIEL